MKQKTKFLLLGALLLAVLFGAAFGYNYLTETHSPETPALPTAEPTAAPAADPTAEPTADPTAEPAAEPTAEAPAEEEQDAIAYPAPDFTVTDMEGNLVSLSDFLGKPIILNFWATWCGPCQSEMPYFDAAYRLYGEDVTFLMINQTDGGRDTPETVARFIEKSGYEFPVYLDTTLTASGTYGAYSIPLTILIDSEGNIVAGQRGALSQETLFYAIDYLLGGETQ